MSIQVVSEDKHIDANIQYLCKQIEKYNIKKIISYDDEWGLLDQKLDIFSNITYGEFKSSYIAEEELSNDDSSNIEDVLLFQFDGMDTKLERIIKSDISELSRIKELIKEKMGDGKADNGNVSLNVLKILKQLLESIKKEISIEVDYRDEVYSATKDNMDGNERILFIIDRDMNKTMGESDCIKKVIPDISRNRSENMDLIIVYTSEVIGEMKTHDDKVSYFTNLNPTENKEEMSLLAHKLWIFNKTHNIEELIKEFNDILKCAAFGHSLYDYLNEKLSQLDILKQKMLLFGEEDYDYLCKEAYIEGDLFVNILDTVQKSYFRQMQIELLKRPEHLKIVNNMSLITQSKDTVIESEIIDIENEKKMTEYRKKLLNDKIKSDKYRHLSEHSLIDYSVNLNYADISTGDLFELQLYNEKNKIYGILINQTCDLILRIPYQDPKQVKRSNNKGKLLLFKATKEDDPTFADKLDSGGLWPIKVNDEYCVFDKREKNNVMFVDIRVLDLCTLNNDGCAKTQFNKENFKIFKTTHSLKYIDKKIVSFVKTIKDNDYKKKLPELKGKDFKDNEIKTLNAKLIGMEYNLEYDGNDESFNVKRIGRLEKLHTFKLIQEKMNHETRMPEDKLPYNDN